MKKGEREKGRETAGRQIDRQKGRDGQADRQKGRQ